MGLDWKNNNILLESVTKTLELLSSSDTLTTATIKRKTVSTVYYSLTKSDFNFQNFSRLYYSLQNCFLKTKNEFDHSELANIIYSLGLMNTPFKLNINYIWFRFSEYSI